MNGVVVINKPEDFTSFDVVAVVRKAVGIKKCGHCGTLDPNATGVLPVLIGNATKAQDIIPNHDKSYKATFKLGVSSDTLDVWGKVLKEESTSIKAKQLESVASSFVGELMQTPPMFSAVSKNGVRLYELARKGIEVQRNARPVTVYSLKLCDFDEDSQCGALEVSCSKGTYIRQLIFDIAQKLGTTAIMTSLIRTSACGFSLSQSIGLEDFKSLTSQGKGKTVIKPVDSLFSIYDSLKVSEAQGVRFSNGNPLDINRTRLKEIEVSDNTIVRVYSNSDSFLGLGIIDSESSSIKMYKNFSR